ncbi:uncharacterized protein LOC129221992 isoform X2 [Uloborus diversus]|nr:uncharacterized protein LOC129221992 isoform X2 [Uloborus diversus]
MCHNFRARTSEGEYDMKFIAAAAVSSAIRLNKEDVDNQTKIDALYEVLNGRTTTELADNSLKTFEKHLIYLEIFLFKMLEGNTSHKVALEFLPLFLMSIRTYDYMEEKWSSICVQSAKLALEMYNCVECISFMPESLAAAAICISLDLVDPSEDNLALCQTLCPFLDMKMLNDITECICNPLKNSIQMN